MCINTGEGKQLHCESTSTRLRLKKKKDNDAFFLVQKNGFYYDMLIHITNVYEPRAPLYSFLFLYSLQLASPFPLFYLCFSFFKNLEFEDDKIMK